MPVTTGLRAFMTAVLATAVKRRLVKKKVIADNTGQAKDGKCEEVAPYFFQWREFVTNQKRTQKEQGNDIPKQRRGKRLKVQGRVLAGHETARKGEARKKRKGDFSSVYHATENMPSVTMVQRELISGLSSQSCLR